MTFYVYTLADPRDGEIFYVGKGRGLRMHRHVVEARRQGGAGNQRKLERIRAILADRLIPLASKVAEYEVEQDAFDHEADLIAVTPGLTNIMAGGGGGRSLAPEEFARRQEIRDQRILERGKVALRERLKLWDEWERRGLVVTFPGLKDGDALAAELVSFVRKFAAA